jgi:hypothetical protein
MMNFSMNVMATGCRSTNLWGARVKDEVPSSNGSARGAQLNRQTS